MFWQSISECNIEISLYFMIKWNLYLFLLIFISSEAFFKTSFALHFVHAFRKKDLANLALLRVAEIFIPF